MALWIIDASVEGKRRYSKISCFFHVSLSSIPLQFIEIGWLCLKLPPSKIPFCWCFLPHWCIMRDKTVIFPWSKTQMLVEIAYSYYLFMELADSSSRYNSQAVAAEKQCLNSMREMLQLDVSRIFFWCFRNSDGFQLLWLRNLPCATKFHIHCAKSRHVCVLLKERPTSTWSKPNKFFIFSF